MKRLALVGVAVAACTGGRSSAPAATTVAVGDVGDARPVIVPAPPASAGGAALHVDETCARVVGAAASSSSPAARVFLVHRGVRCFGVHSAPDDATLTSLAREHAQRRATAAVVIEADDFVTYQEVVRAIDALRAGGLDQVSLGVSRPHAP
jgi:biopolymer transport protein ExbD